jgi:hypothetical protein
MNDNGWAAPFLGRADDEAILHDMLRLRRRFDPLLEDGATTLEPEAERELRALARIHDLDEALSPAELWRTLRLLLAPPMPAAA